AVDPSHVVHGPPPRRRLQNFPEAISFSAALSSIVSASSRFSRRFSSSSVFRRFASDTCSPPYFAFHLYSVVSLIACCRHRSAPFAPAACSRRISMICSSVNRLFFIVRLPRKRTQLYNERVFGGQVTAATTPRQCNALK